MLKSVDRRHGFTCEFSCAPDAHRDEYDAEEERLRAEGHTDAPVNDARGLPYIDGKPYKGHAENFDITGTGLAARAEIRAAQHG